MGIMPDRFNSTSAPRVDVYLHNGPVCQTCGRGYIGAHECSAADLQRMIDGLQAKLDQIEQRPSVSWINRGTAVGHGATVYTTASYR